MKYIVGALLMLGLLWHCNKLNANQVCTTTCSTIGGIQSCDTFCIDMNNPTTPNDN